jgi:hypothetical protein
MHLIKTKIKLNKCLVTKLVSLVISVLIMVSCSTATTEKEFENQIDEYCVGLISGQPKLSSNKDEIESVLDYFIEQAESLNSITKRGVKGEKHSSQVNILKDASQDLIKNYQPYLTAVQAVKGDYERIDETKLLKYSQGIDKANSSIKTALTNIGTPNCVKYTEKI